MLPGTDEEARARADGATFFPVCGCSFRARRQTASVRAWHFVNMWDEYNKWKRENPHAQEAALRGGLIGSPKPLAKKLRLFSSRRSIR